LTRHEIPLSVERLSKRVHTAIPLRVTRWDPENKPLLDVACTYDISPRGARITQVSGVERVGDIIAIERGLNGKIFCRVVWLGEANSELRGQMGIECVESDRTIWEAELHELEESYDPIVLDQQGRRIARGESNRRRKPRFTTKGVVELFDSNTLGRPLEAGLGNLSEIGCLVRTHDRVKPGTDLRLALAVGNYDVTLKGEVRHSMPDLGLGIEFREIRKGDRQMLQFLLHKLAEQQFEESFELELGAAAAHP
jgi:hypothetical protein